MRYRALSPTGDYTFGQGSANFLVNTPETVAQAVKTRLLLMTGEWFLDVTEGTPYATDILGKGTQPLYDAAIQNRIKGTQGVTAVRFYESSLDPITRSLTVTATIDTLYGQAQIQVTL